MITSSHNPWNWNGVKFKANFGGSATPAIMKKIEDELLAGATPKGTDGSDRGSRLQAADYIAAICAFADLDLHRRRRSSSSPSTRCTAPAAAFWPESSPSAASQHIAIRQELNPLFPGINPEPILPHLRELQETVVRAEVRRRTGHRRRCRPHRRGGRRRQLRRFAQDVSACCCEWLLKRKKWPGAVVRAFNTTRMLDRIAAKYGRKLIEHGDRLQVRRRPDDGARDSDRRRGVGRHRLFALSCPSATAC